MNYDDELATLQVTSEGAFEPYMFELLATTVTDPSEQTLVSAPGIHDRPLVNDIRITHSFLNFCSRGNL